ncbi:MAG: prolipoprotein diacylglyceryl transferase [Treponema sp.]
MTLSAIFTPLYLTYPKWIHPELFPNVPMLGLVRWYGLMYIFAFVTAFLILKKEMKEGALNTEGYIATEDDIFSFIACGIVFLLLGARIFSTLVYDTSGLYWKKPWLIFWPFDTTTHQFTGLAGMSYHGGFIGGLLGMIIWCKKHKKPVFKWIDAMAVAIPIGYTFGRIGNFMNGELYGRITTMPWGIVFPHAERFSSSLDWVQAFADKIGMVIQPETKLVNLPRHPSQLYEAFFEGFMLWLSMWFLRKHKPFDGFFTGFYTIGYGTVRFIIEYFREPDTDLGYRISPTGDTVIYENTSLLNISTGQILCFLMILAGIAILITCGILSKKKKAKTQNR